MVAIYVALIMAGRRSVESVPGNLKAAVQAELETRGLGDVRGIAERQMIESKY
jgi:hypothetical protein